MKVNIKILCLLFTCVLFFFLPCVAFAHMPGQPPFLSINGKFANYYPVGSVSISTFDLPQDLAPETYVVRQQIHLTIDKEKLPVPAEILNQSIFMWEFGDGQKASGFSVQHVYSSKGSYLIKLFVNDGTSAKNQLLESVLVHALPNKNYQLPQSIILIDGRKSSDPLTDTFTFLFGKEITFDGSSSENGSSKIKLYYWDFGDGQTSKNKTVTHTYTKDLRMTFPMLRVIDENGLISDSFVQINNERFGDTKSFPVFKKKTPMQNEPIKTSSPILPFLVIIVVLILLVKFFRKKK